jgi:probable blue pigment (indigoidine) exporter
MKINSVIVNSLLTALAPAIWGSTYLVTTQLLPPDSPLWVSVIRALPAGLILLVMGRKLPSGVWWFRALILGILNIGAFFYFLFLAAYLLPGGVAALVMSCQPIIVLLLGAALLDEKIRHLQVLACLVGGLGVALLVLQPVAHLDTIGILAALAGAASMASGIILMKYWGRPEGVSILNFTGWQLTVGGIVLVPLALVTEGLPNAITGLNWIGFAYLSIIGTLFAYVIWFRGIERLPAISVSFLAFASPLVAAILGFIALGESFNVTQILGSVAIIAALVLVQPRARTQEINQNQTIPITNYRR